MTKEEILEKVNNCKTTTERNIMGCYENWYNPIYAIRETFEMEVLEKMSEVELNNLIKLADNISEGLY